MITQPERAQYVIDSNLTPTPLPGPPHPPPPPTPLSMLECVHWSPGYTSNIERGEEGGWEGQDSACRWLKILRQIDLAKYYDQDCLSRQKNVLTERAISPKPLD